MIRASRLFHKTATHDYRGRRLIPSFEPLERRALLADLPMVQLIYMVPSDRQAQEYAIDRMRCNALLYQSWISDQMDRNGFGPKTFALETEADGVTPEVHVVHVSKPASAFWDDPWNSVSSALQDAGTAVWQSGHINLVYPEIMQEMPDGSIKGGVALGGGGEHEGASHFSPVVSGQWSVVSGQWSVVSGQWSVGSGWWRVGSG